MITEHIMQHASNVAQGMSLKALSSPDGTYLGKTAQEYLEYSQRITEQIIDAMETEVSK